MVRQWGEARLRYSTYSSSELSVLTVFCTQQVIAKMRKAHDILSSIRTHHVNI